MKKGYISLDIDGTITGKDHLIPDEVAAYLTQLHRQGWQMILITGRIFSFAMRSLSKLNFPFYLGVQNGADLIEMPSKTVISREYLLKEVLLDLAKICEKEKEACLAYAGFDTGDSCYYQPSRCSSALREYLKGIEKLSATPWKEVGDFNSIEQQAFSLLKVMAPRVKLEWIEKELLKIHSVESAIIKDPYNDNYSILLITALGVTKGETLRKVQDLLGIKGPTIAAGDDENDISQLQIADIGIAMGNAPESVKRVATITAPPSSQNGIIKGLNEAIRSLL